MPGRVGMEDCSLDLIFLRDRPYFFLVVVVVGMGGGVLFFFQKARIFSDKVKAFIFL